jgi:hypothetical protein
MAVQEKTFYLRDYLSPGGRYPYERLPKDMQAAFDEGYGVMLLSVPGFPMISAYPEYKMKKPWCVDPTKHKPKCYKTAAEAFRNRYMAENQVSGAMQVNAAQPAWLVPALVGGAVLGALILFSGKSSAASAAPAKKTCPVDKQKFEAWLIEKQLAGECAPDVKDPPYTYVDLQKSGLAPAEFSPYVLVIGDGSFWYYSNINTPVSKSENLRNQYNTYLSTLQGHPADMFMVA